MFGKLRNLIGLFVLTLAVSNAAVPPAGAATQIRITKINCTAGLNVATCKVTTSVPTRLTLTIGLDRTNGVPQMDRLRKAHSITTKVAPETTYFPTFVFNTRDGKTRTVKYKPFTTLAPGKVKTKFAIDKNHRITANGSFLSPIIASGSGDSACWPNSVVTKAETAGINTVEASFLACDPSGGSEYGPLATAATRAIGDSAWYITSMSTNYDDPSQNLRDPLYSGLSPLLGWGQVGLPEIGTTPQALPSPPNRGSQLTFMQVGMYFWSGLTPEWIGTSPQPPWSKSLFLQYAERADVMGFNAYPYQGSCQLTWGASHTPTLDEIYDAESQLASETGKPVISSVNLTPMGSACNAPALTPARLGAQLMTLFIAGADSTRYELGDGVSQSSWDVATAFDRQQATLAPVLASGEGVPSRQGTIRIRTYRFGGNYYIRVVNTDSKHPAMLKLTGLGKAKSATAMWQKRNVKVVSGTMTDRLAPHAWRVYRIPITMK